MIGVLAVRRRRSLRARLVDRAAALLAEHPAVPGVQWAVVRGRRVLASGALGLADRDTGERLTRRHLFQLASNAKPVTALAACILADRGVIDLDAPVWRAVRSWRMDEASPGGLDPGAVTLRMILSHTSGLGVHRYPQLPWDHPSPPSARDLLDGWFGPEHRAALLFRPGERCAYSAAGYTLAQVAMEEATGRDFPALVEELVADPLRLRGLYIGRERSRGRRLAELHDQDGLRRARTFYPALASSGLIARAESLARLYAGFPRLITASRLEEMLAPALPTCEGWCFGLGFVLAERDGHRLCKHAGWSDGVWGLGQAIPDLGIGIAACCSGAAGKEVATGMVATATRWYTRAIPGDSTTLAR